MAYKDVMEYIKQLSHQIKPELISWRRYIHMYPELSGEEEKTAKFVAQKLREFKVDEVIENFKGTKAVVAVIKGKHSQTVALRADMDALPIEEKTDREYSSKVPKVMHACGHDVHTAILLGVAKVLTSIKEHLQGNVKLIFQPCEERLDCEGAKALVEKGVLKNPDISAIFGLHVYPDLPAGTVGVKKGKFMASADFFRILIKGKSAHAARPYEGIDAIWLASQVVNALYSMINRKTDPLEPVVLTIGKIQGGFTENVIAEKVEIKGTVRTLDPQIRKKLPQMIKNLVEGITSSAGATYQFEYIEGNPPLINSERTTRFVINELKELLGEEKVVYLEKPSMGGEDFAEYLQKVEGTMFRLGVGNKQKGIVHPLHSQLFDIDEEAIPVGVEALSYIAYKWLLEYS